MIINKIYMPCLSGFIAFSKCATNLPVCDLGFMWCNERLALAHVCIKATRSAVEIIQKLTSAKLT